MTETARIIKTVAAVVLIVGGTFALYFAPNLAQPLFVGGIAWSVIPA